jgi:hypothetical protein
MTIPGHDSRLQSQYGVRRQYGLYISGIPGPGYRVLYGPHLSLPPGLFRFELSFEVETRGMGMLTVDLTQAGGHRDFYMRRCFEWELHRGLIRISYPFRQATNGFELRLYASDGFAMLVKQLDVIQLAAMDQG